MLVVEQNAEIVKRMKQSELTGSKIPDNKIERKLPSLKQESQNYD